MPAQIVKDMDETNWRTTSIWDAAGYDKLQDMVKDIEDRRDNKSQR
jgi:hypothetical protein